MRDNFSITNERVIDALQEAKKQRKASKLIEDAILYYLDAVEKEYITRIEVESLIVDCLKSISVSGPISNKNYTEDREQLTNSINDILDL